MAAWRYEISLLVWKKYFTCSLRSLVKYISTLKEKFRISARPCNILYISPGCNFFSLIYRLTTIWGDIMFIVTRRLGNHSLWERNDFLEKGKTGLLHHNKFQIIQICLLMKLCALSCPVLEFCSVEQCLQCLSLESIFFILSTVQTPNFMS